MSALLRGSFLAKKFTEKDLLFRIMTPKETGRHAVEGVAGSKPRLLRAPKVPRRRETVRTAELGEQYLRERNQAMRLKRQLTEMELAARRGRVDRTEAGC
jgi:hypothetical protein